MTTVTTSIINALLSLQPAALGSDTQLSNTLPALADVLNGLLLSGSCAQLSATSFLLTELLASGVQRQVVGERAISFVEREFTAAGAAQAIARGSVLSLNGGAAVQTPAQPLSRNGNSNSSVLDWSTNQLTAVQFSDSLLQCFNQTSNLLSPVVSVTLLVRFAHRCRRAY